METVDPGVTSAQMAAVSFGQQRLWLIDRLLPGRSVYNEMSVASIRGHLDTAALQRAFQRVVDRHEVLRTRFAFVDGEPHQVIAATATIQCPVDDVPGATEAELDDAARKRAEGEGSIPFDLGRGPVMRARLLRLAPDHHWLVITMHHIASDAWTAGVLRRELSALYAAELEGRPSPLAELPIQYADYASWQREWMQGEALDRELRYWKRALADVPVLSLPLDRPRPAVPEHRCGRVLFTVDAGLARAMKELARKEGATLFMTLLAAYFVLLHRYSGQDDIAVAVPVAGRNRPELENLIGFFVNTLVLRGDLAGDPSFRELLRRVRSTALGAFSHQDAPFEKLVEVLAPSRDLARNPLAQVSFALQNVPAQGWNLPGCRVESVTGLLPAGAKFELSIGVTETDTGLQGRADYMAELFDAGTITRMVAHFRALLGAVVADPDMPVSRLPLHAAGERQWLVHGLNDTAIDYPDRASLADLFEAQVARSPESVAIVAAGQPLRYAELDARANRLADALLGLRMDSNPRIGVLLDPGIDLVVSLLAAVKIGAAYVPLDPALPVERLALLMRSAEIAAVVTDSRLESRLPPGTGPVLCVDRRESASEARAPRDRTRAATAADIACVMFTSGSTGDPKGVLVRHRSIAHLVCGTDYVQLGPDDIVAQVANPAFDASTFEIWGALLNGARLVVIPRDVALSPSGFAAEIERTGITTLFLTTALFNQVARDAPAAFRHCRNVLFGGETAEAGFVASVLAHGAPGRLLHMYGPTETTTFATFHEVRSVPAGAVTIPIGRPIARARVYVLDRHGEPAPVDVAGELHIGGPGVAAGYLNAADLTAHRFVPDPFSGDPDAKLYRTGDLARRRGDGVIEFMGRMDRQVKLRGYRIEPGEIESALLRLPDVKDAVVVLHGTTSDDRRLSAYVVPASADAMDPQALWAGLRRTLPDYMVPGAFVFLAALPLTPNGKIDRAKLPDPKDLAEQGAGFNFAPGETTQRLLAAIWEELLGVTGIGTRDSFFDRGGHSLLAARMVDRVEAAFGVRIPLSVLFTHSTLEQFALAIRDEALRVQSPLLTLNDRGTRPPIFFLHGDFTGGGFFSRTLARAMGTDWPFHAVHPHGLLDDHIPETIGAMAAERLTVLRAMRPHGPYVLGGHCAGALVALEMARTLVREGEDVPLVFIIDARAPRSFEGPSFGNVALRASRRRRLEAGVDDDLPAGNAFARYREAMRRYRASPYAGRMLLLQSETAEDDRPALGWTAVNARIVVRVVAGDHHSMITTHLEQNVAVLRACLEELVVTC